MVKLKDINSHIQLPNCVLKYFRDGGDREKKVWYLDIPSGQIRKKAAKKLGTAKGYFSQDGEKFWDQSLENPLAALNEKIRKFVATGSGSLFLSDEEIAVAKRYIKAASIRSKLAQETMIQSSLTADMLTEQQNHDALARLGMSIAGEFDQIFADMSVTVLINQTERSLVVPRNCYYAVSSLSRLTIIAPISPRCALLFLAKDYPKSFKDSCAIISDPAQIEQLNIFALKYEYMFNCKFVASDSQFEVEFLQRVQQEHRTELEALKQI